MNYVISIIAPERLEILTDLCEGLGLPLTVTLHGRGTAVQSMLDLLGIESNERRVVLTIAYAEKTAALIAAQKRRLHIGMRHISLSTCGLVDQIDRLAGEDLQLTLSVSLHAPVDEVRSSIMPVNRRWPVQELLDACRRYFEKTGRRISFEYAMIRDVNDTPEMAKQLIRRLRGIAAHVNLIPLNDVAESPLKPSLPETVLRFQKTLEASGIPATVRRTLGSDINASCGQLRRNYEAEKPKEGSGMDGSVGTDGHGKRA